MGRRRGFNSRGILTIAELMPPCDTLGCSQLRFLGRGKKKKKGTQFEAPGVECHPSPELVPKEEWPPGPGASARFNGKLKFKTSRARRGGPALAGGEIIFCWPVSPQAFVRQIIFRYRSSVLVHMVVAK